MKLIITYCSLKCLEVYFFLSAIYINMNFIQQWNIYSQTFYCSMQMCGKTKELFKISIYFHLERTTIHMF